IQTRLTGDVHSPRLFPHLDNTTRVRLGRYTVQMAQFCDGVSNGLIHRSFSCFPAADVDYRNIKRQRGKHSRQHLESVAEPDKYVRAISGIRLPEAKKTDS